MAASSVKTTRGRFLTEITPPVARLRLHNAPLNVIDIVLMEEMNRALAEIEAHSEVCVIVLCGEGKSFSAGVDVAAHVPEKVEEMLTKFHSVIRAIIATKKVTIAAVQGHCLGGGAELAMVCDMVFTTDSAKWSFPEIKLGCYPPVACTALAALVGRKRAAELILTGRTISGREAEEIGLANRAVAEGKLAGSIEEFIGHLRKISPAALAVAKKASYAWDSVHFDKGLARAERIYFEELMKTEDTREGIAAFMEKREPKWKNR